MAKRGGRKARALTKNKYLLDHEFDALEATLAKYIDSDERNCLALWTLLKTGARAQELLNITKKDLDPHEKSVFINGLKDSLDRDVPIPAKLFDRLYKFAQTVEGDRVFDIQYSRLQRIWYHYRPAPKKLHSTRHTAAVRLFRRTKNIRLVQLMLGHTTLTPTTIYMDYLMDRDELKQMVED